MKSNTLLEQCMTAASVVAWLCLFYGLLLPGRFTTWPMWMMTIGASLLLSFAIIFACGLARRRNLQVSKGFTISAAMTSLLCLLLTVLLPVMPSRPPISPVSRQMGEMKELLYKIYAYQERLGTTGSSPASFDQSNLTAMGVFSPRDITYITEKRIAYYGFPSSWTNLESPVLVATNKEAHPPLRLMVFVDGSGRVQKLSDPFPIQPAGETNPLPRTGP